MSQKIEALMLEAKRRITMFHTDEDPLTVFSGLGTPSEYKPVVKAGLMKPSGEELPYVNNWYILTPKGLDYIERIKIVV